MRPEALSKVPSGRLYQTRDTHRLSGSMSILVTTACVRRIAPALSAFST